MIFIVNSMFLIVLIILFMIVEVFVFDFLFEIVSVSYF